MAELNVDWAHKVMTEASDYFHDVAEREKAADARNRDLVRVHQEGWTKVARAIDGGFRVLADAIRDHGRR